MIKPEKQALLNEIEGLSQNDCAEVLDFVQFLKQKKQKAKQNQSPEMLGHTPKPSLLELQGLGKEIWQNIDTEKFLETERNTWS